MMVLGQEQLYGNLKKCSFFTLEVVFVGYIVLAQGISDDQSKVEAIKSWLVPTSMHEVRSFHGLGSFYKRVIRHFSSITAPMTEVLKGSKFTWTPQVQRSFKELKEKLTYARS